MTPYLGAITSLLELLTTTPYLGVMTGMIVSVTPYKGTICCSRLLELSATFGSMASEELEIASVSELDSGLAAVALELGCAAEELDALPAVALDSGAALAELDFGVSIDELDSGEFSSLADEVLSQLAQKKLVTARANFFQCL